MHFTKGWRGGGSFRALCVVNQLLPKYCQNTSYSKINTIGILLEEATLFLWGSLHNKGQLFKEELAPLGANSFL